MSRREEIVKTIYENYCEDERLERTRHGQLEYLTTMTYIHKYLNDGARILEIGAGTGRYSIALAKEGYNVTAVELVNHNLDILRHNGSGIENLTAMQGDALDLSMISDDMFDLTLITLYPLGSSMLNVIVCEHSFAVSTTASSSPL
jgi:16S rRNA A1518/A1519 N6-dimethyltransferase RsmA/KsgA/DIM1 with predicted DNA glycosylase/AP lyase activity